MKKVFYGLVIFTLFLSCEKEEKTDITPVFNEFMLKAELHKDIFNSNVLGTIKNDTIFVTFPRNLKINSLTPSFTTNAKKVTVNGVDQISGKTKVDFSKKLVYTLISETDTQKEYPVKVNYISDKGTYFSKFLIEKKFNSSLKKDIITTVSNDTIYGYTYSNKTSFVPTFETKAKQVFIGNDAQKSGINTVDFSNPVTYKLISNEGFSKTYTVVIQKKIAVAHMYITTENNTAITSKKDYVKASFKIESNGAFDDYKGKGKIRGRGNTTWGMPKKPYKIKLSKKAGLLGMKPEKTWVLLANYLDPTLMLTATAMKIGEQLDVDYINHIIPVDVTLNGKYIGQYNLTEKIQVKKNRVDVENGVLLEVDANYDEDYQFKSHTYKLPVMFKYPKKVKDDLFNQIKGEINHLESLVNSSDFPNNNYSDYFDKEAFAKYIIVYLLTDNEEINHPKSTYINKKENGKYRMGPIWDFDWAYGYEKTHKHFSTYKRPLFWENSKKPGTKFFRKILSDPAVASLVKEKWNDYKTNHFQNLLDYLDAYYKGQKQSRAKDYKIWETGTGNFDNECNNLKKWLKNRVSYLDGYIGEL